MRLSALHVRSLIDAIRQLGLTEDELFEGSRLDRQKVESSEAWIELEEYEAILLWALQRTGNPALGLHWGEKGTLLQYDIVTHLVCTAPTLRGSFEAISEFYSLLTEEQEVTLSEDGNRAIIECRLRGTSPACARMRTEVAMVGFLRVLRFFGGTAGTPDGVYFAYAPPPYAEEYERVFEQRAHFGHAFTGLSFDRALLDRRNLAASDELYAGLQEQARERVRRKAAQHHHTERVLSHLRTSRAASPKMPEVARQLGMSCRSLRRRLNEEGASFPDLVAQVKASVAKRLLVDQRRSVEAIADEMGFSSASAFHRAFRRWTGKTPLDFRRVQAPARPSQR